MNNYEVMLHATLYYMSQTTRTTLVLTLGTGTSYTNADGYAHSSLSTKQPQRDESNILETMSLRAKKGKTATSKI